MRLWPLLLLAVPALAQYPAPADWDYKGVFRVPYFGSGVARYYYGMTGMTFYDDCGSYSDPTPLDGYPGCLCAVSNNPQDKWGCFEIIPPELVASENRNATYYNTMDEPTNVVEFFDPSGGIQAILDAENNQECTDEGEPWDCCVGVHPNPLNNCGWAARDQPGMIIFDAPNDKYIVMCGHDWYNTTHTDHDTHCWGDLGDLGVSATGAWNFDNGTGSEYLKGHTTVMGAHAQRVGWYLGAIPQDWANAHLAASGTQMCFTGMYRMSGGISSGPTLYSFPCDEPGDMTDIDPTPLISYPSYLGYGGVKFTMPNTGGYGPYDYPTHTPNTQCRDAVWIDAETDLVAFNCRLGGPVWWYGQGDNVWEDCNAHRNDITLFHDHASKTGTLAVTLDDAAETQLVIEEDIATLAPGLVPGGEGSDILYVEKDTGGTVTDRYASYTGSTFTFRTAQNYTSTVATAGKEVTLFCNITDSGRGNDPGDVWLKYGSTEIPADPFPNSICGKGKGYWSMNTSSPWYNWEIQFYLASDIADVASGLKQPWEIAPYTEIADPDERWENCGNAQGIAFDGSYLYAVERFGDGLPVVHVYEFLGEGEPPEPPPGDSLGVSSDGVTDAGAEG